MHTTPLENNNYKIHKSVQFYTVNPMVSHTQHMKNITCLVAINKLYDTTVTCLAQFPDNTS